MALLIRRPTDIMVNSVEINPIYSTLELICVDIAVNGEMFRIIVYYRPSHYISSDIDYLSKYCISTLISTYAHNTILMGDFNMSNVDWIHYSASYML